MARSPQSPGSTLTDVQLVRQEFRDAQRYAAEYVETNPQGHFFNTRLRRAGEMLGTVRTGPVLAIGCGPAKCAELFRDTPAHFFGLDISEEMLRWAKHNVGARGRTHFGIGLADSLPFPESSFEAVLCLGVVEYLSDPVAAFSEVARVLKDDGIALVSMHNRASPYRMWLCYGPGRLRRAPGKLFRALTRHAASTSQPGPHAAFTVYSEKRLRELVTASGLVVDDVLYYDFNVFLSPLDRWFPEASVRVSASLERFCRSRLRYLGSAYIVRARKRAVVVPEDVRSGPESTGWPT
jgi:SAM-dependent methyltransferase